MRLKTTWQHVRRSPYQSLAAVLIMTLTFFIASIFILIGVGGTKVIDYFESRPQITAFFRDEASQEQIARLQTSLTQTEKISSTNFVSKEEALKIYQEQNKDDPLLLELVTANVLPASLEVSAVNVKDLDSLSQVLKNSDIISEVVFQKDIVDTLISWTNAVRKIGLLVFLILALISILIIITALGMKISIRREEIEILRLVGASAWYIRLPFIVEGVLYGLIGSFIAWLLSYGALLYATPFINSFLFGIPILPISPYLMLGVLGIELVVAIMLGVIASFAAVLRYLK